MVLRVFWNVGAGLVQRALTKHTLKPGMALTYPAIWRARPGFLDCDINLHLNNASYLFNMELARWHFTASTGILYHAVKNRRMFLAGSQVVRYRHAIPPFRPYEIRSQIVFWDDTWIYFLQQFQCPTSGKVYAEGLCRVTVREGERVIPGAVMYAEIAPDVDPGLPTEMPDIVREFLNWDEASKTSMEATAERGARELASGERKKSSELGLFARLTRATNLPF